jgi:hypothetical protein
MVITELVVNSLLVVKSQLGKEQATLITWRQPQSVKVSDHSFQHVGKKPAQHHWASEFVTT